MVIVSVKQQYAGHAAQVLALTAQCPAAAYYTKWVIAVDEDVDPTDFNQVMWALSTRFAPGKDLIMIPNASILPLDPSAEPAGITHKIVIDATVPVEPDVRGDFAQTIDPPAATEQWEQTLRSLWNESLGKDK